VCISKSMYTLLQSVDRSLFDLETPLPPPLFGFLDEVGKARTKSDLSGWHHRLFRTGPGSTSS
jgi:hypothetical protein